jgi:hypothetical protein
MRVRNLARLIQKGVGEGVPQQIREVKKSDGTSLFLHSGIGGGAFGDIYLASSKQQIVEGDKLLALKVERPDVDKINLQRESEGLASLNASEARRNIPSYEDVIQLPDGRKILVMEYLSDPDLGEVLKEYTLTAGEVLAIVEQTALVFRELHEKAGRGFKDFHEGNLKYDSGKKTVKCLDFGMADLITDQNRSEVVKRDTRKLACVLHNWLTGDSILPENIKEEDFSKLTLTGDGGVTGAEKVIQKGIMGEFGSVREFHDTLLKLAEVNKDNPVMNQAVRPINTTVDREMRLVGTEEMEELKKRLSALSPENVNGRQEIQDLIDREQEKINKTATGHVVDLLTIFDKAPSTSKIAATEVEKGVQKLILPDVDKMRFWFDGFKPKQFPGNLSFTAINDAAARYVRGEKILPDSVVDDMELTPEQVDVTERWVKAAVDAANSKQT